MTPRPVTRGDCAAVARPCPHTECRYWLAGGRTGESCALDVADRGGVALEELGDILGVTRERARQVEEKAMERLGKRLERWLQLEVTRRERKEPPAEPQTSEGAWRW